MALAFFALTPHAKAQTSMTNDEALSQIDADIDAANANIEIGNENMGKVQYYVDDDDQETVCALVSTFIESYGEALKAMYHARDVAQEAGIVRDDFPEIIERLEGNIKARGEYVSQNCSDYAPKIAVSPEVQAQFDASVAIKKDTVAALVRTAQGKLQAIDRVAGGGAYLENADDWATRKSVCMRGDEAIGAYNRALSVIEDIQSSAGAQGVNVPAWVNQAQEIVESDLALLRNKYLFVCH